MDEGGPRREDGRLGLDERSLSMRHRFLLVLLWAHVPLLAVVGMAMGVPLLEVLAATLVLTLLGTLGTFARSKTTAAGAVSLGLMTAAGILMFLSGGLLAANFYFFLMLLAVAAYRDWRMLTLGVVYATVYQLGIGIAPVTRPDPAIEPMWWATISSAAVLAAALVVMAGWRLDTRSSARERLAMERFRQAFSAAPPLAILRPSGEVLEANPAMADLLGYEIDDLCETDIRALVHGDDLSELGSAWEEIGNGEAHTATAWMRCLTSDGRSFWAHVNLEMIPWAQDRPAVVILHLADATRAHDTELRLEAIISGKDEFVASIGDELRIPLSAVIDLTQMEENTGDPTLSEIGAHAREISNVMEDLVVSARFDAGTVTVVPRFIDTAVICRDVLARTPGSDPVIQELRPLSAWADPQLTQQIVTSLLGNAIRFGGDHITLRTVSSGPDTVIQVIDDGPEIPVSDRHRIFSSDLHAGRPVTQPASVGLGLTVGRRLARQMDGDIVYRRANNHRNVFELRLPSDQLSQVEKPRQDERMGVSA